MRPVPARGLFAVGLSLSFVLSGFVLANAQDATPDAVADATIVQTATLPDVTLSELLNPLLGDFPIADDHGFLMGGTGSDLWQGPDDAPDEFWMITDRGPNQPLEVDGEELLVFPVPGFTPTILHVRTNGDALELLDVIPLTGKSGAPVTGVANLADHDPDPFGFNGEPPLPVNPSGLDTEGLVRTSDGDFWITDEYSPSLAKVSATGEVLTRYVPEGLGLSGADYEVKDTLPALYGDRRTNRGLEGLALSPDEQTLYLLLQSPLSNPDDDTARAALFGRILAVNAATGKPSAEYIYPFEIGSDFDPAEGVKQGDMKLSGLVALDDDTLLVLERTDAVAKLYTVELAGASNILGSKWDDPMTAPSLEAVIDLAAENEIPLAKQYLLDLDRLPNIPDKIEGIAVIDAETIAVANDNDFSVDNLNAETGEFSGDAKASQLLIIHVPPIPGVSSDMGAAATPGATSAP